MSLLGDALSHAVLPGVALGFLWNMNKDPWTLFAGAVLAGLFGTWVVGLLTRRTVLKEDGALALVLSGFYGLGVVLLGVIYLIPGARAAGLQNYMFGQAAALSHQDVWLMAVVASLILVVLALFYKELLLNGFDSNYARSLGIPAAILEKLIWLLLAFAVVSALQSVGVVLVSAMLIAPAAAAYLLTKRFHIMLLLAALIGMFTAWSGSLISYVGSSLPTGPFMVMCAGLVFVVALFAAPQDGIISRWRMARNRQLDSRRENLLRAIYLLWEHYGEGTENFSVDDLERRSSLKVPQLRRQLRAFARSRLIDWPSEDQQTFSLTAAGWREARLIVRKHRLWETYLQQAARFPDDHVHADAEIMEHFLDETELQRLERRLGYPKVDPHGRSIPEVHPNLS
ncbi:MAG: metal ABC transporter permease [Verrucomicrobia bacterium]|nr:metal ABC transporter permease [Verrucomicrobiota bacterium]